MLKKIASFTVDHTTLKRGIYLSRKDGDIVTFDLRMKLPNSGNYLENAAMHTIEHRFATYARSSLMSDCIIYVGPMGCRTGFYLLVRDTTGDYEPFIKLVRESFEFIRDFNGDIPGTTEPECGNFREHNLAEAKKEAAEYVCVLDGYTKEMLKY